MLMSQNVNCPLVVVTDLSNRIQYYQWFVYGLQLLAKEGKIRLKFQVPFSQRLLLNKYAAFFVRCQNKIKRIVGRQVEHKTKAYFRGEVINGDLKHSFCIDSADSPNMFSGKLLKECDVYFKLQCPKIFSDKGFLMGNQYIQFFDSEFENPADEGKQKAKRKLCPEVYEYQYKIKPVMVGPRSMGQTWSFYELDAAYKNLLSARSVKQTGKAMCYFGNAAGPVPTEHVTEPDWDWESDILGYYGDKMNHPNEKRAKVADIMQSLGDGYDARVINRGCSDTGAVSNQELIIPLKDFSKHVAKFQYNVNISGYRMSIPARFIDSFVCGTAIATDNLHVRWYHPFGDEVTEIGEMGYLPDSEVDYSEVKEKLKKLKPVNKEYVIEQYEKYWAPDKVAQYIINCSIATKPL